MLKKLEKIESKFNEILEKLIALFFRLIHKILPKKVFQFINQTKQKFKDKKIALKNWCINSATKSRDKIIDLFIQGQQFLKKISEYSLTSIVMEKHNSLKEYFLKTPLKTQIQLFKTYIESKFSKWTNSKSANRSSNQIYIAMTAVVMILTGAYGVYQSTQEIIKKEFPNRTPASVQEYDTRPDYKMYARKTTSFLNMKLPISVEDVADIDSITMDISVRTSTRWARFYLQEYEHQLKDYFFTTVEPVVSDFPLTDEGKEILKEKIRVEINNFLREHGVEGEVEDVRLVFIVAS